jgi:hypothetical protein
VRFSRGSSSRCTEFGDRGGSNAQDVPVKHQGFGTFIECITRCTNMQTSVEKKSAKSITHNSGGQVTMRIANRERDTVSINARDDANIHFKGGPCVQSSGRFFTPFLGQIEYFGPKSRYDQPKEFPRTMRSSASSHHLHARSDEKACDTPIPPVTH